MSACRNVDVGQPARSPRRLASDSAETSIDVKCAPGLLADSVTVCAPTPQPASSTRAAGRVARVAVQQLDQRARLVVQPLALARVVAVDVAHAVVPTTR